MPDFAMTRTLATSFDDALALVPEALRAEGFGVLTEIDVQATLKAKLGVDFRRYRILGACNPPFAHQALSTDLSIGVLMPCNVVVYEGDDGRAVVTAIDPMQTMAAVGVPGVAPLAAAVRDKLVRALDRLR